jgi:hypothetical protein
MNSTSNQTAYLIKAGAYPGTTIASGTAANTISAALYTGPSTAGLFTDILFRNASSAAVNLNIILVPSGGSSATEANSRAQIQIPANAGNNGSVALASLAALAPALFDLDLAGNRVVLMESGDTVYVQNVGALTGDLNITVKARNF